MSNVTSLRQISFILFIFFNGCLLENKTEFPDFIQDLENLIILSANMDSDFNIELIHEKTFGASNEVSINWYDRLGALSWLAGLEVDEVGRVFVGEYGVLKIHVFDPDGTHLKSLGGGLGSFQVFPI